MSAVFSTRNKLRRAYRIGLEPNRFQGMNSFFAHGLGDDCSHLFSGFAHGLASRRRPARLAAPQVLVPNCRKVGVSFSLRMSSAGSSPARMRPSMSRARPCGASASSTSTMPRDDDAAARPFDARLYDPDLPA